MCGPRNLTSTALRRERTRHLRPRRPSYLKCMNSLGRRYASLLASALFLLALPTRAQQLGKLDFPTSGSAAAQPHFIIGVLYLHSFEYPSALKEFREAERLDPRFAMAYWGEAMTYTHPVWNEQDADAARAALVRLAPTPAARLALAPTPREQGYLRSANVLYGTGSKAARDTAYAAAMADLARRFPQDDEAQLFYALALLGLNQGIRDVPTYERAGAIAQPVLARHPDHPGAAHYVIHAYDDPTHAAVALDAARAYSRIAPDAAHAQHMTSHIFLALGLWDDVVSANVAALQVAMSTHTGGHEAQGGCGHVPEWLEYGYLQQGRRRDAAAVLDGCMGPPEGAAKTTATRSLAGMRAAFIVDSHDWSARYATEEPAADDPDVRAYLAFGTGYAAAMRADRAAAARSLAAIENAIARAGEPAGEYAPILRLELSALVLEASGDPTRAIAAAREAARLDDAVPLPFGPPATIKPPHELAGELYLAHGKPNDARREFQLALARTPRRPTALLGLAQAERALGASADATAIYAEILQIWHAADPDLPQLAAARAGAAEAPR